MEKIWYIKIDNVIEGPFSVLELKKDKRITPETMVWRKGLKNWIPIGKVTELKEVFEDEEQIDQQKLDETLLADSPAQGELAIDIRSDPPYLFWAIVLAIILTYLVFQFSRLNA